TRQAQPRSLKRVSPQPNLQSSDFAFNGADMAFHSILAAPAWFKILRRNIGVQPDKILEKSAFNFGIEKLMCKINRLGS
ncbi:MAG: hypothetical protein ABL996_26255, partial [Micropepsaceae bacterium]